MIRTTLLATVALTACSAAEPQVDQKVLKRAEVAAMRQQAEEERYTPEDRAERDRMVATAQLRAKLGVSQKDGGIGMVGGATNDPDHRRKTQAMAWQALRGKEPEAGAQPQTRPRAPIPRPTGTATAKVIESSRKIVN